MTFVEILCPRCQSNRVERADATHYRCQHCASFFLRREPATASPPVRTFPGAVPVGAPGARLGSAPSAQRFNPVLLGGIVVGSLAVSALAFAFVFMQSPVAPPPVPAVPAAPALPSIPTAAVTLNVTPSQARAGTTVAIAFSEPLAERGDRHWLALVSKDAPDDEWGEWQYVDVGATTAVVKVTRAGAFEVRLHSRYPERATNVVARAPLLVTAP